MNTIQQLIDNEKLKAIEFFNKAKDRILEEMNIYEYQSQTMLNEINGIQSDIEKNIDNIVKNIDVEPFKDIISRYKKKLNSIDFHIDQVQSEYITINKLPPFKKSSIEAIKPLIIAMYNPMIFKTSLIRCNNSSNTDIGDSSNIKNIGDTHPNLNKNSLYISFDNKEMFKNAVLSKNEDNIKVETIINLNNSYEMTFSNISEKIFHNQINASGDKSKTSNVKINNIEFDNLMNIKKPNKSPKYNRRVNSFFLDNTIDNDTSRLTSKSHNQSMKYDISQHNLDTYHDNIEKKLNTNSIKPGKLSERVDKDNTLKISPKRKKSLKETEDNNETIKYMNILDKINNNQTLKSDYYSNIIKNSPLISARYIENKNNDEDIVAEEGDDNGNVNKLKSLNNEQEHKFNQRKRKGLNKTVQSEDNRSLSFYNIHPERYNEKKEYHQEKLNNSRVEKDDNLLVIKSGKSRILIGDNNSIYAPNEYSSPISAPNLTDIKLIDLSLINGESATNKKLMAKKKNMIQKQQQQKQKDIRNFGNFFMFIENKINSDDNINNVNLAYQKTLFCSPNFKDNLSNTKYSDSSA